MEFTELMQDIGHRITLKPISPSIMSINGGRSRPLDHGKHQDFITHAIDSQWLSNGWLSLGNRVARV
ncbi:MAG: hypothetical protein RBJ76_04795 [Stenomitos frigidus ULC029]